MTLFASIRAEAISGIDFEMDQIAVKVLALLSPNPPASVRRSTQFARLSDRAN